MAGIPRLIPAHAGKTWPDMSEAELSPAHPRSRGENEWVQNSHRPFAGSSPLTRGKRHMFRVSSARRRLIPAHAGKTDLSAQRAALDEAHPRSRGENVPLLASLPRFSGSSPLTRGKQRPGKRPSVTWRLIPAHAGKTTSLLASCPLTPAHPRSRGENTVAALALHGNAGSSPLTRGKLASIGLDSLEERLIPAHAGKTASQQQRRQPDRAHPRSRGENDDARVFGEYNVGSSPLTRGKQGERLPPRTERRLIPAHAGKTVVTLPTGRGSPAHPRSRGENSTPSCQSSLRSGSSPLTRGKRTTFSTASPLWRLIPAHAGKTGVLVGCFVDSGAHPRSRGENAPLIFAVMRFSGSSPLTRGKLCVERCMALVNRLIPAHAGKTPTCARYAGPSEAHPRSRGENESPRIKGQKLGGSSPLTRGKHRPLLGR